MMEFLTELLSKEELTWTDKQKLDGANNIIYINKINIIYIIYVIIQSKNKFFFLANKRTLQCRGTCRCISKKLHKYGLVTYESVQGAEINIYTSLTATPHPYFIMVHITLSFYSSLFRANMRALFIIIYLYCTLFTDHTVSSFGTYKISV